MLRGWWIPVLTTLMAGGLAAHFVAQQTPVYRAEATFVVQPSQEVLGSREATINSINVLDRRTIVNTFAEIARSQSMALQAATKLGYGEAAVAGARTRAVVLPETFVVQVSVEDADRGRAAALANAIVQEAGAYALGAYPTYQTRRLDAASAPAVPVAPRPARDITLAALVGLGLGLAGALGFGYLWGRGGHRQVRTEPTGSVMAPSLQPR